MSLALVLMLGLVAGTVGGVVGFGTSIMLMPALVLVFGPREAVPIMAIAAIFANAARVLAWWRDVDWRVTAAYSVTAIPAAVLGARTLLSLEPGLVELLLGLFFIGMIGLRRWIARQQWLLRLWHMAAVGAVIGYVTGVVVSTGPISAPFFWPTGWSRGPIWAPRPWARWRSTRLKPSPAAADGCPLRPPAGLLAWLPTAPRAFAPGPANSR